MLLFFGHSYPLSLFLFFSSIFLPSVVLIEHFVWFGFLSCLSLVINSSFKIFSSDCPRVCTIQLIQIYFQIIYCFTGSDVSYNNKIFKTLLWIHLDNTPRRGIVSWCSNSISKFIRNFLLFSIMTMPFYIPINHVQVFQLFQSLLTLIFLFFW